MPIACVQTDNGMAFTKRFSTSGKETLTLFQRTLIEQGFGINESVLLLPGIMEKRNAATARITNGFMHLIPFIPSGIFPDSFRFITAEIIIRFP